MALPDLETLRSRAAAIPAGLIPHDVAVRLSVLVGDTEPWTMEIGRGRLEVRAGADGDVVIHIDRASAERIADGLGNAQQAIAAGAVRIDGDLDALPPARSIEALGALLGPVPPTLPVPSDDHPRRTP